MCSYAYRQNCIGWKCIAKRGDTFGIGDIKLVSYQQARFRLEPSPVGGNLPLEGVNIGNRIGIGEVDEIEQSGGARDMLQKTQSQPVSLRGSLDYPRNIRDNDVEPIFAIHTEIRHRGRERVGADSGPGIAHGAEQTRLTRVRKPDKPDIGNEPDLDTGTQPPAR